MAIKNDAIHVRVRAHPLGCADEADLDGVRDHVADLLVDGQQPAVHLGVRQGAQLFAAPSRLRAHLRGSSS
jgi:hypothetical protein